jgi:hypothetical protein
VEIVDLLVARLSNQGDKWPSCKAQQIRVLHCLI